MLEKNGVVARKFLKNANVNVVNMLVAWGIYLK